MGHLNPTPEMFLNVIDHTYLKTEKEGATLETQKKNIEKLISDANKHKAFSVCVREGMVKFSKDLITKIKSPLKIVSVVGFPDGDNFSIEEKIDLLRNAEKDGADEFDMVIPYESFRKGDERRIFEEVLHMSKASGDKVLKVIFENCYLTHEEKNKAYEIVIKAFKESGAVLNKRFLKTSTGFAKVTDGRAIGATLDDIKLMFKHTNGKLGIKPAGGVKDYQSAIEFFNAAGSPWKEKGVSIDPYLFRIGSSSLVDSLLGEGNSDINY